MRELLSDPRCDHNRKGTHAVTKLDYTPYQIAFERARASLAGPTHDKRFPLAANTQTAKKAVTELGKTMARPSSKQAEQATQRPIEACDEDDYGDQIPNAYETRTGTGTTLDVVWRNCRVFTHVRCFKSLTTF